MPSIVTQMIIFHENLGNDDDNATLNEKMERILYYYSSPDFEYDHCDNNNMTNNVSNSNNNNSSSSSSTNNITSNGNGTRLNNFNNFFNLKMLRGSDIDAKNKNDIYNNGIKITKTRTPSLSHDNKKGTYSTNNSINLKSPLTKLIIKEESKNFKNNEMRENCEMSGNVTENEEEIEKEKEKKEKEEKNITTEINSTEIENTEIDNTEIGNTEMKRQLQQLHMIQSLIIFSSRFCREKINYILCEKCFWCLNKCEANVWIAVSVPLSVEKNQKIVRNDIEILIKEMYGVFVTVHGTFEYVLTSKYGSSILSSSPPSSSSSSSSSYQCNESNSEYICDDKSTNSKNDDIINDKIENHNKSNNDGNDNRNINNQPNNLFGWKLIKFVKMTRRKIKNLLNTKNTLLTDLESKKKINEKLGEREYSMIDEVSVSDNEIEYYKNEKEAENEYRDGNEKGSEEENKIECNMEINSKISNDINNKINYDVNERINNEIDHRTDNEIDVDSNVGINDENSNTDNNTRIVNINNNHNDDVGNNNINVDVVHGNDTNSYEEENKLKNEIIIIINKLKLLNIEIKNEKKKLKKILNRSHNKKISEKIINTETVIYSGDVYQNIFTNNETKGNTINTDLEEFPYFYTPTLLRNYLFQFFSWYDFDNYQFLDHENNENQEINGNYEISEKVENLVSSGKNNHDTVCEKEEKIENIEKTVKAEKTEKTEIDMSGEESKFDFHNNFVSNKIDQNNNNDNDKNNNNDNNNNNNSNNGSNKHRIRRIYTINIDNKINEKESKEKDSNNDIDKNKMKDNFYGENEGARSMINKIKTIAVNRINNYFK